MEHLYLYRVDTEGGASSYLSVLPPDLVSEAGLSPEAIVGTVTSADGEPLSPGAFIPNQRFVEVLHPVVSKHGPGQAEVQEESARIGKGWRYVVDRRTPTPAGPVPPEHSIGYFEVRDGGAPDRLYRIREQREIEIPQLASS